MLVRFLLLLQKAGADPPAKISIVARLFIHLLSLGMNVTQQCALQRCSSKALSGIEEGWDLNTNPLEISADTYHHFVFWQFSWDQPVTFVFACLPAEQQKKGKRGKEHKGMHNNPLIYAACLTRNIAQCVQVFDFFSPSFGIRCNMKTQVERCKPLFFLSLSLLVNLAWRCTAPT